ncbi:MAG: nuclear transport factor 2 family protein [Pseudomonadota bacterium]
MTVVTRDLVDSVGAAFNANDIEAVMKHFADDAIFDHAVGPDEHGVRFEGTETIRGVFAGLFDTVENVHWDMLDCAISGNKAYCEYRRTATHKDGKKEEFLSVDILTYRAGLIVHKDTYYKQRNG